MCTPRVRRTLLDARETVSMSLVHRLYCVWVLLLAAFGLYWLYSRVPVVRRRSCLLLGSFDRAYLLVPETMVISTTICGLAFGIVFGIDSDAAGTSTNEVLHWAGLSAALSIYVLLLMGRLGFLVPSCALLSGSFQRSSAAIVASYSSGCLECWSPDDIGRDFWGRKSALTQCLLCKGAVVSS